MRYGFSVHFLSDAVDESSPDEPFSRRTISPRAVDLARDPSYERGAGEADQEPHFVLHHGTVNALLLHSGNRLCAGNSLECFGDSLRDLLGVLRWEYLDEELGIRCHRSPYR